MAIITIYEVKSKKFEIKKKRTLCSRDAKSNSYSHLSFMPKNDSILICTTNGPQSLLCMWEWEKSKLKAISDINGFV